MGRFQPKPNTSTSIQTISRPSLQRPSLAAKPTEPSSNKGGQKAKAESTTSLIQKVDEEENELVDEIRQKINEKIISQSGLLDRKETPDGQSEIKKIITETFYSNAPYKLKNRSEHFIELFYNDICGFGPIQVLLNQPNITEIKVNGPYTVRVEEKGVERLVPEVKFRDIEHLMDIIQRIVSPIARKVDMMHPIEDAFLPDGSRVNIVIPPVAVDGPYLSIRKFVPQLTIEELCRRGAFREEIIPFLRCIAQAALNVCVSGGTGGGKTSLLNAWARFIPENESLIAIEDTLELDLHHPDVRRMLTRPANMEGKGEITASMLVKASLRMKPKRIIVGEVRDKVIIDCLSAMNTGHPGSAFTIHSNSPQELPERVEFLADMPKDSIHNAFAKIIDIVFQVNQLPDGRRRLVSIAQLGGYVNGEVVVEELFTFNHDKDQLERTDIPFRFEKEMRARKIEMPEILVGVGTRG